MKKVFLFLGILFISVSSFAYQVITVQKSDKGIFGYDYVEFILVTFINGAGNEQSGYQGTYHSPGLIRCRPPMHFISDESEQLAVNRLLDIAEDEIDAKHFNGESIMRIEVAGEETVRLYTVAWNCDEKGNGTISIDREDV
jgi:hypothetical protein